ncbi:hypothetical protein V3C99_008438 [Haemonchus contortus]
MKKGKPTPTLQLKVFSVSQKMIAPIPMIPKTKKKRRRMTEDVFRCTSPIEYFKLFMTDELVTLIVEQTDCAGLLKKIYERTKLTAEEFDRFIGICFYMGLVNFPRLWDYWSTNGVYSAEIVRKNMTRHRFESNLRCLHFLDNETADRSDRLNKIN